MTNRLLHLKFHIICAFTNHFLFSASCNLLECNKHNSHLSKKTTVSWEICKGFTFCGKAIFKIFHGFKFCGQAPSCQYVCIQKCLFRGFNLVDQIIVKATKIGLLKSLLLYSSLIPIHSYCSHGCMLYDYYKH